MTSEREIFVSVNVETWPVRSPLVLPWTSPDRRPPLSRKPLMSFGRSPSRQVNALAPDGLWRSYVKG
jgi:hypothetical protein